MKTSTEYARVHHAARKAVGAICQRCGGGRPIHAALRPDVDPDRVKIDPATGCPYSTSLADYHALCIPCHRQLDARTHCYRGHEFTAENTRIGAKGRICRICHREREAARRYDPAIRDAFLETARQWRACHPLTEAAKARKLELQRIRRARRKEADESLATEAGNRVQWKAPC